MSHALRAVIAAAEKVFQNSRRPLETDLNNLRSLVAKLTPNDVNLESACVQLEQNPGNPLLGCMDIYRSANISVSVFIMRTSRALIPLHDHPSMIGLIKVLKGKLAINAFTKVESDISSDTVSSPPKPAPLQFHHLDYASRPILAYAEDQLIVSADNEPNDTTSLLTETLKNYHEIMNKTDSISAFFDILAPPYKDSSECGYYELHALERSNFQGRPVVWLLPRLGPPSSFSTVEVYLESSSRIR